MNSKTGHPIAVKFLLTLLLLVLSQLVFAQSLPVRQFESVDQSKLKSEDYYKILGISRVATSNEVRSAFRRLIKQHHPDANGGVTSEYASQLIEAYNTLIDPQLRKRYDETPNQFIAMDPVERKKMLDELLFKDNGQQLLRDLIEALASQASSSVHAFQALIFISKHTHRFLNSSDRLARMDILEVLLKADPYREPVRRDFLKYLNWVLLRQVKTEGKAEAGVVIGFAAMQFFRNPPIGMDRQERLGQKLLRSIPFSYWEAWRFLLDNMELVAARHSSYEEIVVELFFGEVRRVGNGQSSRALKWDLALGLLRLAERSPSLRERVVGLLKEVPNVFLKDFARQFFRQAFKQETAFQIVEQLLTERIVNRSILQKEFGQELELALKKENFDRSRMESLSLLLQTAEPIAPDRVHPGKPIDQHFLTLHSKGEPYRVVLIGADHGETWHAKYAANWRGLQLVRRYARPGDVVLVEGVARRDRFIQNHELNNKFPIGALPEGVQLNGWGHQELQNLTVTQYQQVLSSAENTVELFSNSEAFMRLALQDANVAMAKNIERSLRATGGRVFVLAGRAHVLEPDLLGWFERRGLPYLVVADSLTEDWQPWRQQMEEQAKANPGLRAEVEQNADSIRKTLYRSIGLAPFEFSPNRKTCATVHLNLR